MVRYMTMSVPTRQELLWRFREIDDPEIEARRQEILSALLEMSPRTKQQLKEEGILEGELTKARAALRRVLTRRQLMPSKDDDARIEACTDVATLDRWLDQAVTATSIAEALA